MTERLKNLEQVVNTKIFHRIQCLQYKISPCRTNLQKYPGGGIGILKGEIEERSIGSIRSFNSSKVPCECFTVNMDRCLASQTLYGHENPDFHAEDSPTSI